MFKKNCISFINRSKWMGKYEKYLTKVNFYGKPKGKIFYNFEVACGI